MNSLGKYSGYTYAIMRIIIGLLFACHGGQKLFGMFGGHVEPGLPMVAGVIELVGGFMIAFGFLTRPTAFLCCGLMAVAYFMVHARRDWFPVVNRGELAVVYCFIFLYIFTHGGGLWSLDSMIWGHGKPTDEVGGPMRTGRNLS